jgi:hypothetical protein
MMPITEIPNKIGGWGGEDMEWGSWSYLRELVSSLWFQKVSSHTAVVQWPESSHQHRQEQEGEEEGHHHQSELVVPLVQVLLSEEKEERQNDAMVGSEEGRKIHNLLPALVGWQTEVSNKTKEQSVE